MSSYKNAKKDRIIGISAISVIALVIVAVIVLSTVLNDNGIVTADGNLSENYRKSLKTEKITDNFVSAYDNIALKLASSLADSGENVSFSVADTIECISFIGGLSESDTKVETEKFLTLDSDRFAKSINTLKNRTEYSEKNQTGLQSGNLLYINNLRLINVKKRFLKENGKIYGVDILRDNFSDEKFYLRKSDQIVSYTGGLVSLAENFDKNGVMSLISTGTYRGGFAKNTDTELTDGIFNGHDNFYDCKYFKTIAEKSTETDKYFAFTKEIDDNCTFLGIVSKKYEEMYPSFSDILTEITTVKGSIHNFAKEMTETETAIKLPNCVTSINSPYNADIKQTLVKQGIKNVFGASADLSRFAAQSNVNPNIDNFYIAGDINIAPSSENNNDAKFSAQNFENCKVSYNFDSSFIYFICDTESMLPIYFGKVNQIPQ